MSKTQYEEDEARVLMLISEAMVRVSWLSWIPHPFLHHSSHVQIRTPWVSRWLVKIDDESMGTGTASLDLRTIKGASDVLHR